MKYCVFSDFDGTITTLDTLVTIFDTFIGPKWLEIEEELIKGNIPQKESLALETNLLQGRMSDFILHIKEFVKLREGFVQFVDFLNEKSIPFFILSGGFKTFIREFFALWAIKNLEGKVFANDIKFENGLWHAAPSPLKTLCGKCLHCKTNHIEEAKKEGFTVIYIGDGQTDKCAALSSDIIFARGTLKKHLDINHRKYYDFETFDEIIVKMEGVLNERCS